MTRRVSLALAALLLAAGPARAQDPSYLLDSGRQAYEAGDYERARADLWSFLEATASLSGAARLPQAEALFTIARMEADAAVAVQHYRTIVDEYPASSIADEALFRLGQYALVTGHPGEARERFLQLKQNYPVSRYQAEVSLWVGRSFLAERRHRAATDALIEGFARVRTQDLPFEIGMAQADALAAEHAYWLATAFQEEGDRQTALQYWSLLALDYGGSPQAAEARAALEAAGRPVAAPGAVARTPEAPAPREEPVALEAPPPAREEPVYREIPPAAPVEEPVVRETPPPAREEPVVREAPPAREEPVYREIPPAARVEEPPKFPAPGPAEGPVFLQVGAFSSAARAADLSKRLRADGFPSSVEIGIVDGQGYYRVRVGPYRLPAEAEALGATESRLRQMGYPAAVVEPGSP